MYTNGLKRGQLCKLNISNMEQIGEMFTNATNI